MAETVAGSNFQSCPRKSFGRAGVGGEDAVEPRDGAEAGGTNDILAFDAALCRGNPAVDTGGARVQSGFLSAGGCTGSALFGARRRHRRMMCRVFAFAIVYSVLAEAAASAGLMNPLVAAIIMPPSSRVSIGPVLAGFSASCNVTSSPNHDHEQR